MSLPDGYITAHEVACRINVTEPAVYYAIHKGKLDHIRVGSRYFIKDASTAVLRSAFPNTRATDLVELYDRWMTVHDIRSMGERAAKDTT